MRPVTRSAISTASVVAVEPSHIEAFATSWPGQLAHQRLKFEDGLQRALRDLGLVGRVGGEKFAALNDRVGHHRAQVVVDAGAQKARVTDGILRGALLEVLDDFGFGERARAASAPRAAGSAPECWRKDRRSISRRWPRAFLGARPGSWGDSASGRGFLALVASAMNAS